MKMKNTSILVLSLLVSLSALRAVPVDPSNPSTPTAPTAGNGVLMLTPNDAATPQTITIDATNTANSQAVIFSLPIVDIGGTWGYMITNEDVSKAGSLVAFEIGDFNKFTKNIDWNHTFELTCFPTDIATSVVSFFYMDSSHAITASYTFTINSVAATASN